MISNLVIIILLTTPFLGLTLLPFALSETFPSYCKATHDESFLKNKAPVATPTTTAPCSNPNLDDFKKDGRTIKANAPRPNGHLPSWINIELARKGQKFALDYLPELGTGHLYGLLTSGYPDGAFFLMFTGQSGTVKKGAKRYLATLTQVLLWYQDPLPLDPNTTTSSDILTSLSRVHAIHTAAAAAGAEEQRKKGRLIDPNLYADYNLTTALAGAFLEDLNASDIPASQRILPPSHWTNFSESDSFVPMNQQMAALTQYCFMGYPVLFPERLGIKKATDDEIWAFNHLWAVLGYALGIEDKYNIALQPDLASARALYKDIWENWNIPNLFHMDKNTIAMMEVTMKSVLDFSEAPVPPDFFLYRILTDLVNIKAPKTFDKLTPIYKLMATKTKLDIPEGGKRTPLDDAARGALNVGVWGGLYVAGIKLYGVDYSKKDFRAKNVYVSQYA